MRRARIVFGLVIALAIGACAPASADLIGGYAVCSLTTTAVTVCTTATGNAAHTLVGLYSNSPTAQTASVTCYDSISTATGAQYFVGPLGLSQQFTTALPGRPFANGIVCQASAAPTGNGIEVYVR